MSLEKVERFLTAPEEEGQPRRQRLPFTVAREDSSSLFQATNFFSSNGTVGTHRELFGISDQIHQYQQPSDHFSLEESKCLSIGLKDQLFCGSHGFPAGRSQNAPIKWMSSKMRVMRKMMAEEHISAATSKPRRRMQRPLHCQPLLSREINAEIRVCSGCSTTKTPLWRSGPQGPKSLCNACGIRQMKARRAVVASPAPPGNAILRNDISGRSKLAITRREKKYDAIRSVVPYKKRHKFADPLQESSPSAFHPAFPQDEKDAAILLMALSCG